MTIKLPSDLEDSVRSEVLRGHFAGADDLVAEIVRDYFQRTHPRAVHEMPTDGEEPSAQTRKPIWEVAEELRKSVPAEEWEKLPVNGAAEHDHYIYGTPKRSTR